MSTNFVLKLLIKYGGSTGLTAAGNAPFPRFPCNRARRDPALLAERCFTALGKEGATLATNASVELLIP